MSELVMPRLSDTMEEGTILRWLKGDGEAVARGEELVEIETDKATMTYESDLEGVLAIVAPEGATLAVGSLIATVGQASGGHAAAEAPPGASAEATTPGAAAAPANGRPIAEAPTAGGADAAAADSDAAPAEPPTPGGAQGERVKASPLARRMAQESGIDLHALTGSGPGGRIVKADVQGTSAGAGAPSAGAPAASAARAAAASPASAPAAPADGPGIEGVATAKGETTEVELTRIQQTIARRMAESKATIPEFAIQADVDMEGCVALRAELKRLSHGAASPAGEAPGRGGAPTYNDMVVKACALALREHPRANASYRDGRLQLHSRINVGVAVAARDALVVPTVFDAEEKSLGEIARETRRLAERVREGTITPPELGGGTFTVSNLGMYGVKSFTAIVNPPQAAILSVGSLEPRAVVREGAVLARHTLTLTLVCDHRVLYGADAAELLARIRELLQTPSALTL